MKYLTKHHPSSYTADGTGSAFVFALLLSLMFLLLTASAASAQEETDEAAPPARKTAQSIIRGQVIYSDTQRPVRRAELALVEVNNLNGVGAKTVTDEQGRFTFKNVAAGSYIVAVDSPGIVNPHAFIQRKGEQYNYQTEINEVKIKQLFNEVSVNGTNEVEVKVLAQRGGAISGKVTYADGDPAVNVQMGIRRKEGKGYEGVMTGYNPTALLSLVTDDRGMYRVAGLPPGEYIVSAVESNTAPEKLNQYSGNSTDVARAVFVSDALSVVYYGGASQADKATVIEVTAGSEIGEINLTIPDLRKHTLSGTVIAKRDGRPLHKARILFRPKEQTGAYFSGGKNLETDEQGRWSINGVPDGTYLIKVSPPQQDSRSDAEERPSGQTGRKLNEKQEELIVAGSDLAEKTISLADGARVSGVVIFEGAKPRPNIVTIALVREEVDENFGVESDSIDKASGKFTIEGATEGKAALWIYPFPDNQYYVKAITLNGKDLLREPFFEIGESAEVKGIQITLASDAATLRGRLLSEQGNQPVPNADIILAPVDPAKWIAPNNFYFTTSGSDGKFSLSAAPGEYLIVLPSPADKQRYKSVEEFLKDHATTAPRVTLQPDEIKNMNLVAPVGK